MNTARSRRAAAAATAVLAPSACGGLSPGNDFLDQSPRSMAKAAFDDMRKVTSMRILGSQESDEGFTRIDIRVAEASCTGSLDTDNGTVEILKNTEGAWFSADESFWRAQAPSAQAADKVSSAYAGKWVTIERKNPLLTLCRLDELLNGFKLDKDDTDDTIKVGDVTEIGSADAVAITGQEDEELITAWVAVGSPHRVLKMAPAKDTGRPDALFFEEFGADVVAESPPKKDIVTIPGS